MEKTSSFEARRRLIEIKNLAEPLLFPFVSVHDNRWSKTEVTRFSNRLIKYLVANTGASPHYRFLKSELVATLTNSKSKPTNLNNRSLKLWYKTGEYFRQIIFKEKTLKAFHVNRMKEIVRRYESQPLSVWTEILTKDNRLNLDSLASEVLEPILSRAVLGIFILQDGPIASACYCGKLFLIGDAKKGKKFCSDACRAKAPRTNVVREDRAKYMRENRPRDKSYYFGKSKTDPTPKKRK